MLAMGCFLAGVVVAVALLEFHRFGLAGRATAIGVATFWSCILVWAGVRLGRRVAVPGHVAAGSPDPPVASAGGARDRNGPAAERIGRRGAPEDGEVVVGPKPSNGPKAAPERPKATHRAERGDDGGRRSRRDRRGVVGAVEQTHDRGERETEAAGEEPASAAGTAAANVADGQTQGPESSEVRRGSAGPAPDRLVSGEALIRAWRRYLQFGDGHFNATGLRRQLAELGVEAVVVAGDRVDAGDNVLVVQDPAPDAERFFVLPSFTKSPRSAPEWYADRSDGALTRRTHRIHRLAEGKWTEEGFAVVAKGSIE